MIEVTEKAVDRALKLSERDGIPAILRVGVRGGGCTGMSYVLDFETEVRESDHVLEDRGLKVIIDPKSLQFLEEVTLDYESNLLNGGFKFHNPSAKQTCSCGESFSV